MGLHIKNGVHYGSGPDRASQLSIIDTEGIIGTAGATTNTQALIDGIAEDLIAQSGKVLTDTLAAGSTSLTFTDSAITNNSLLEVYTNIYGVSPKTMTQSGTTVTLTFKAQESAMVVKLVIKEE